MTSRFLSLQQLRGVAALLVVIAHTTEYPLNTAAAIAFWTSRVAELGVEIFFVVSGFIITVVCGPGRFSLPTFLWRRLLRVVPLYWLCTTVVLVLAVAAPTMFKTTTGSVQDYVLSLLFIPHVSQGDAVANHWSPMLKPGWTLNLEIFFYLVVAALFWCPVRRLRSIVLTLVLGALLATRWVIDPAPYGVLDFYANINFISFLFGVWLAEAILDQQADDRRSPGLLILTTGGALVATVALFAVQTEPAMMPLAFPAAALIVFAAVEAERLGRLPTWRWLIRIGDASYSLYLTHLFTLGLLWTLVRRLGAPIQGLVHAGGVGVTVVAVIAVAFVSYRLIEQPFIRLAHRSGRAKPRVSVEPAAPTGRGIAMTGIPTSSA